MSATAIRTAGICAAVSVAVFAAATARLFVWPGTSALARVDAVVVFGARNSERLPEGLRLVREGVAPVLVVMTPPEDRSICRQGPMFEVICRVPEPFTTRGEARAVSELAGERGWSSVLLVTSTHHLTRARLLLDRCFDGSVRGVATNPRDGFMRRLERIAHEWAALIDAVTFSREC
jgi:uncharacterized SAM-binding protein YcdF (DUF218 family)